MVKWLVRCLALIVFSGCAFNTPVHQYLSALQSSGTQSYYAHDELGEHGVDQAPLSDLYLTCTDEVFSKQQFEVGDITIDDPYILELVYRDYHAYLMESVVQFGARNQKLIQELVDRLYADNDYTKLRRNAFESDPQLTSQIGKISRAIKKRDFCLRKHGWHYKHRR